MSSEPRESLRARLVGQVSPRYSPALHLMGTTMVGLVAVACAVLRVHALRPLELLVIPLVFVIANGVEWRAHKDLLHHRRKPFQELYDRHTPQHHMVFHYDDMAIRDRRELRLVLIPAIGVLAIVIAAVPMALVAGWMGRTWLGSDNVGWIFLASCAVYVVTYELSHMSYHLPEDSFIGGLALVRVLREHHARHHDPRLMQRWNFNVTVPLFDWLHGTIAKRELVDARAEAAAPGTSGDVSPVRAAEQPSRS